MERGGNHRMSRHHVGRRRVVLRQLVCSACHAASAALQLQCPSLSRSTRRSRLRARPHHATPPRFSPKTCRVMPADKPMNAYVRYESRLVEGVLQTRPASEVPACVCGAQRPHVPPVPTLPDYESHYCTGSEISPPQYSFRRCECATSVSFDRMAIRRSFACLCLSQCLRMHRATSESSRHGSHWDPWIGAAVAACWPELPIKLIHWRATDSGSRTTR
jgi:hypothetical protein